MKKTGQKKKQFIREMERLKESNDLKEEAKSFEDLLKKSVTIKRSKPSLH